MFTLEILDQIIDTNILGMDLTLVGRFLGANPNIEVVWAFIWRKWTLKGQVDIIAMVKGFLSLGFFCEEYKWEILYNGP